ncbi:Crp/Fnr family transcriptional regulator [Methylobacterium platani]|uniref:CarD family transcriptional regulator n=2 Tax=Methylobacterium platani TaxID=427683 RepID=A0A179SF46_9HYPH|nr:Crp/Fnr family transcriptional regulator [Methylobacterium platani]KMO14605.1 CarD family transcriptional regulator [Methylobacterium platani JCM 14648]OAS26458.1 CarD family transcriptional regulator [Methylobacterium platani]
MPLTQQSKLCNRLLRVLAPEDFAQLQPYLEPVSLQLREVVIAPDAPVEELFFIETGMVSISTAHDERRIEVGLVGREGLVGAVPVALDGVTTPHVYFAQLSGEALSIGREAFCAAIRENPVLRRLLLRYVHVQIVQITQTAYAHASMSLEGRLARWLLMCHDRTDGDELVLTHEFLSMMLGVQRAGVTLAIQNLEGAGRIRAKRRRIEILDRDRLLALTNGSYGTPEAEYARLIEGA